MEHELREGGDRHGCDFCLAGKGEGRRRRGEVDVDLIVVAAGQI